MIKTSRMECNVKAHVPLPFVCNARPRCSYCSSSDIRKKVGERPLSPVEIADWHSALLDLGRDIGPIHYVFVMGEPMADDGVVSICKSLSSENKIEIVSNMISPAKRYEIFEGNIRIAASYHPHLWNDPEDFLSRVDAVVSTGADVYVIFIVATPNNFDEIVSYRDDFMNRGYPVSLIPFGGDVGGRSYPSQYPTSQWAVLKSDIEKNWETSKLVRGTDFPLRGSLCRAGMNYGWIGFDGTVWSCYTGPSSRNLGNIFQRNVKMSDVPLTCLSDTCPCVDMSYLLVGSKIPVGVLS